jgi:EAL domain-containing protein (putative c-di-GMP-specific phosphodiesterase class I)
MTTIDQGPGGATAVPVYDDDQARAIVVEALHAGAPTMVVQPILDLATGRTTAYEALSRFTHPGPPLSPEQWFALAERSGLSATLQARAVDLALRLGRDRPTGSLLSVNVSPAVLSSLELQHVLPYDLTGLQFEITEKELIEDPAHLGMVLGSLRQRGGRIAVDDVGEGYAGLQRVMTVSPDVLKLDRSLVTGVQGQPGKAAMVEAVVRYAGRVGALVCAEGVENLEDLYVLADLDVAEAQGWVIGVPTTTFQPASEPARLTCESSFARALAVGGRTADPWATPSLEHVIGRLVDVDRLDLLAQLMVLVADVVGCDRAEVSSVDPSGSWLEALRCDSWQPEPVRYALADFPASAHVLASQEMVQVLASLPEADPNEVAWMQGEGFGSLMLVPVVSAGRPVGLLECCKVEEQPWSREQLRTARILGTVLGPVLDNLLTRSSV